MSQRSVVELFERSAKTFRSALAAVRPEHHHLPTPCDPLDVSELVARAVGHQNWVGARIAGRSDPPAYSPIEPDAWMVTFDDSTRSMVAELDQHGVMDRNVELAAELTFSGSDVGVLAARNIFQFAWDLSVATGQSQDIAPDVAGELWRSVVRGSYLSAGPVASSDRSSYRLQTRPWRRCSPATSDGPSD